jgi:hypothetical protein
MNKIYLTALIVLLHSSVVFAKDCKIPYSDNPFLNHSIHPGVSYKWNPDLSYAINPNVTYSINPNLTEEYNPDLTQSINPVETVKLNPHISKWNGYNVCTPNGELVGASVIANKDVMVVFTGKDWIGNFITNKKSGYNFFNLKKEWKGFLVPTKSDGYAFFNRENKWVLSLIKKHL